MGKLTTHVLDTANGCPAVGMMVTLSRLDGGAVIVVGVFETNDDGRLNSPLLSDDELQAGIYELTFAVGDYFRAKGQSGEAPAFLDKIPVQFGVSDTSAHYHVPLLVSPYGYSTYRGS